MLFSRVAFCLALFAALPCVAQQGLSIIEESPDHLRKYNECMNLARSEPLKALPAAEKWHAQGGSLAARHCVATAMFGAGRYTQAAAQFEAAPNQSFYDNVKDVLFRFDIVEATNVTGNPNL